MPDITVPYSVPYVCQFASRDHVRAFVYDEIPLTDDPQWAEYGASTPEEYAYWARRSCGVVCVKMAVEALSGQGSPPVMGWVRAGLDLDGYLTKVRPDRPEQRVEYGWKHIALAQLIIDAGYDGQLVADLTLDDLLYVIESGQLVIGSVSSQLGEAETAITRSSGHLVVIWGMTVNDDEQVTHVILHNPSGRSHQMQEGARIEIERFVQAFSGRGIIAG